jgi:1-deoxy-D-xylulose-5-phosphate synthase
MRFVKPLDAGLIAQLASSHDLLVSIEENTVIGGAGAEVARALESAGLHTLCCDWACPTFLLTMAIPPCYWQKLGLDHAGIEQSVTARLAAHH